MSSQLRDFLGEPANSAAVADLLAQQHLPYVVGEAPERSTVAFAPDKNELYTIEEAVVSPVPLGPTPHMHVR